MQLIWNSDLAAWDELAGQCPGQTFYQTAAYLEAAARATGRRFEGAIAQFSPDLIGLVPVTHFARLGGLSQLGEVGGPGDWGGYGGLLCPLPLTAPQVDQIFIEIARTLPNLRVTGNPFAPGPHLPGAAAGFARTSSASRVVELATLRPTPDPADRGTLLWVPGPHEFLADRFGSLESGPAARPRAFYYHLFRLSTPRTLALGLLQAGDETVAAVLIGYCGPTAYMLGLLARDRSPARMSDLLGRLPAHLPASVTRLDLGSVPASALPTGWTSRELPYDIGQRQSLPRRLLETLRAPRRHAS